MREVGTTKAVERACGKRYLDEMEERGHIGDGIGHGGWVENVSDDEVVWGMCSKCKRGYGRERDGRGMTSEG